MSSYKNFFVKKWFCFSAILVCAVALEVAFFSNVWPRALANTSSEEELAEALEECFSQLKVVRDEFAELYRQLDERMCRVEDLHARNQSQLSRLHHSLEKVKNIGMAPLQSDRGYIKSHMIVDKVTDRGSVSALCPPRHKVTSCSFQMLGGEHEAFPHARPLPDGSGCECYGYFGVRCFAMCTEFAEEPFEEYFSRPHIFNFEVFWPHFYLDLALDLKRMAYSPAGAKHHWHVHGINEGRVGSPAFDVKYYIQKNPWMPQYYQQHVAHTGKTLHRWALEDFVAHADERGASSPVFHLEFYLNHNPDLKAHYSKNPMKAITHYITYGLGEGRQASPEFDPLYYLSQHPELGTTYNAVVHWLREGRKQGELGVAP